jgi:uncharacterized cofD-like protein
MTEGPRVVALGGGGGLSVTLTALRQYAGAITAIVSVADDGGSSGRLRAALGIPAPGDLRRCLVALGDPDSVWARSFEHRFSTGELEGHPLGNLVIAGLAAATGDFAAALREAGRLVGAVGQVLPATTEPVVLVAESATGSITGQVAVSEAGRIAMVALQPAGAATPWDAVDAILAADQVVLGPGSLFTSVLPACLPREVTKALRRTRAQRVYVCNVAAEERETRGFDVAAHVDALRAHGVQVDVVLADAKALPLGQQDAHVVVADLVAGDGMRHNAKDLATALSDLIR